MCKQLTSVDLSATQVQSLGRAVFRGCESLSQLALPDGMKSIGEDTFKECEELLPFNFGSALESIGSSAFSSCVKLTQISFPSTLSILSEYAFSDCSDLATVIFLGSKSQGLSLNAFHGCTLLNTIQVPDDGTWTGTEFILDEFRNIKKAVTPL
jgi:hypothetical protein